VYELRLFAVPEDYAVQLRGWECEDDESSSLTLFKVMFYIGLVRARR